MATAADAGKRWLETRCPTRRTGRPKPWVTGSVAVCAILWGPSPVLASGQGQSRSDTGNSSQGSNGSSNNSNDSSKSSNGSSRDSNNSTQSSPKNSADYSTEGTTNQSTNSHGAHVFWAGSAVVLLGASVVGTVLIARNRTGDQKGTAVALATFMRENHAVLTHDVAMANGPVLDAWARELGLTATEKRRITATMEGSREQGELIAALDGPVDHLRARSFSAAFFQVTARALGPARTRVLLARAATTANDS
jgi:hypothetical protein